VHGRTVVESIQTGRAVARPSVETAGALVTAATSDPHRRPAPDARRSILRSHNYRLFLAAQVCGGTGTWMLRLSQDWLVLELTGSPAAVGVVVALQFVPLVALGPLGGVVADRHDKRRLVMAAQSCAMLLAATLATLTVTGLVSVPLLYLFAVLSGLVAVI